MTRTWKLLPLGIALSALCATAPARAQELPPNLPTPEATVEVVALRVIAESAAYQSPKIAQQASTISNFSYAVGNLQIQFSSGIACPLMVDGHPKGVYIKGTGSYRYTAKDPVTLPMLKWNLKENTRLVPQEADGAVTLGEPLTEAVLWCLGRELPAIPTGTLPAPKEAFDITERFFGSRDASGVGQDATFLGRMPLGQMATYQRYNAPDKPIVTAELVGQHEKYLYTYDPAYSRRESFFIQRPEEKEGEIKYVPLITVDYTPIGYSRKAPVDPDFRLSHIDLDMEASNKTFAKYKVTETLQIIRPRIRMLSFAMSDTRAKVTAFGSVKSLKCGVGRVLLNGTQELNFDQYGGYVLVDLGKDVKNGDTLKLSFEIEGDLLGRVSNYDYWRLTPGEGWFPEPEMAGQGYTIKARIAVAKPYIPIASAKTISRSATATHNVLEAALDKPTLWFSIAAGKYTPKELTRNGLTVRAWGYAGLAQGADSLLKTTHGILDYYRFLYGEVPFDEINLVEVPSLGFGQSPAGMIWLTREAFDAIGDDINRIVASNMAVGGWVNRMVAHELAHQYWAHRVKMWGIEDQWITEGFAEYTSALAMRAMKNKGVGVFELIVKDWGESAKKASKASCIPTASFLSPKENGDREHQAYRQWLVYDKSAYLLACLHKELGEQQFIQFLRAYQNKYPWYPPSYNQDVPDLLKELTGRDYNPWFEKYFWGTEMPERKP